MVHSFDFPEFYSFISVLITYVVLGHVPIAKTSQLLKNTMSSDFTKCQYNKWLHGE